MTTIAVIIKSINNFPSDVISAAICLKEKKIPEFLINCNTNDGSGSAETSGTGTFFSDYSTIYNRECAQCFWCFKIKNIASYWFYRND